jgi:hypothetical protein
VKKRELVTMARFKMKNDFYEVTIKSANVNKIEIEIVFSEKEIPEQEIRNLEQSLRLILEACGRFTPNPSKR